MMIQCELSRYFSRIYSVNDDDVTFVLGPGFFFEVRCLQWFHCHSMHPLLYRLTMSHTGIKIAPQ